MLASTGFAFGLVIGSLVLVTARWRQPAATAGAKPSALGWWSLAFGLGAVATFALAALGSGGEGGAGVLVYWVSNALALAAVVVGVGAWLRRDRQWPTWGGLVGGIAPVLFWLVFAIGHLVLPGE